MRSIAFATLLATASIVHAQSAETQPPNATGQTPAFAGQTRAPLVKSGAAFDARTVASGLVRPWAIDFLSGGRMIVTEKDGNVRVVTAAGKLLPPLAGVPAVVNNGQGGMLDVAVKPAGKGAYTLCLTYSEQREGEETGTTASCTRATDAADGSLTLGAFRPVFKQTAWKSRGHYGSRYIFTSDGGAFITLGERQTVESRNLAQRDDNTFGKVVRVKADGTTETWSKGHRSNQAGAINPWTGKLWTIEHGPKGGDELNIPQKGKNYGWPIITYGIDYNGKPINDGITAKAGLEQPVYYWDPVIAPGGMAFYNAGLFPKWKGSLLVGGLATKQVVRLSLKNDRVVGEERYPVEGRVRDLVVGPDGAVYLALDDAGKIVKLVLKG